jgi:Peptidase family M28
VTLLPRLARALVALATLTAMAACSDSGSGEGGSAGETTTTTSANQADEPWAETLEYLVEEGDGRDNQSEGSRRAQERLVDELEPIARPLPGGDGFLHPFDQGTNVLGLIEGTETPEEVVVLGAHYDHLGHDCDSNDLDDVVCDGASDNASGVATVLEIGRRLAEDPPSRSVVLALWDAEEDGKLGSIAAVESGVLDIGSLVAYLNWDMQGTNLLPSLAGTTFVIGAETGGPRLEDAVATGVGSTDLPPVDLSLAFGQGRSDHATFVDAGVPSVFFTDATSACYHTAQDDLDHLDLDKLARQIDLGETVTRAVAGPAARPRFTANAVSVADAEAILALVQRAEADLDRYPEDAQADLEQFLADLEAMVAAGDTAFDGDDATALVAGIAALAELFTQGNCDDLLN